MNDSIIISLLVNITNIVESGSFSNQLVYKLGLISNIMFNIANRDSISESQDLVYSYMNLADKLLMHTTYSEFESGQNFFQCSDKFEKFF